jgi:hypothetical protein
MSEDLPPRDPHLKSSEIENAVAQRRFLLAGQLTALWTLFNGHVEEKWTFPERGIL